MRKLIIGVCLLMLISSCGGGKKKMDPFETLTEEIDSLTATCLLYTSDAADD